MKRPILRHALGYTALIIILSAGAAQSLAGSNTVLSDDIVDGNVLNADIGTSQVTTTKIKDGHVTNADLANDAVTTNKIRDGHVTSSDIASNAISDSKVLDDSLTGADVDESTLIVPSGFASFGIGGDPRDPWPSPDDFASNDAVVAMSKRGNLLVMATGQDVSVSCTGGCTGVRVGLYVDGSPVPKSAFEIGGMTHGQQLHFDFPTFFGVAADLSEGDHHMRLGVKSTTGTTDATGLFVRVMGLS